MYRTTWPRVWSNLREGVWMWPTLAKSTAALVYTFNYLHNPLWQKYEFVSVLLRLSRISFGTASILWNVQSSTKIREQSSKWVSIPSPQLEHESAGGTTFFWIESLRVLAFLSPTSFLLFRDQHNPLLRHSLVIFLQNHDRRDEPLKSRSDPRQPGIEKIKYRRGSQRMGCALHPIQLKNSQGGREIKPNGLANMPLYSPFPNPFINSIEMGFAFRLIMWLKNQHNYKIFVERKFLIWAIWFPFQYCLVDDLAATSSIWDLPQAFQKERPSQEPHNL